MTRLLTVAALALFVAGCSDTATTAPKSLHPSVASFDGTPPPPPVYGEDDTGSLNTSFGEAPTVGGPSATLLACSEHVALHYHDSYLENQDGDNIVAHVIFDSPLSNELTIHRAP